MIRNGVFRWRFCWSTSFSLIRNMTMNKRKVSIIIATVLVAAATVATVVSLKKQKGESTPKYVFLFIGDGMGLAHAAATDSFLAYQDSCYGGGYLTFTQFPVVGLTRTYCHNSGVTDSGAAGTAIACGQKTDSGRIGTAVDGSQLRAVTYDLKDAGYQVGIMSDGPVNHATPAAFYAHVDRRSQYYEIAREISSCGFDFLGGSELIDRYGKKHDKEDIVKLIEADGSTQVCFGLDALAKSTARTKVLLPVYPEDTMDFDAADKNKNYDLSMSGEGMQAPDLIRACLSVFDEDKPFFIMCEQGYVDWASHRNSTMRAIESVKLLDEAVAEAYEFYLRHPDETLILVTSDHETGGLAFGVKGYKTRWDVFDSRWKVSHEDLPEAENQALNERGHVGWAAHSHTGCPVPIYAIGKNAEKFTGFYENSRIKERILCSAK